MALSVVALLVGIVALLQGVAWLGAFEVSQPFRRLAGAVVAPIGYALIAAAVLLRLVPLLVQ